MGWEICIRDRFPTDYTTELQTGEDGEDVERERERERERARRERERERTRE